MFPVNGRSRPSWRRIANVFGVSVFLCSVASGQIGSPPEDREAVKQKDEFVRKVFLKCLDSSLNPPTEEYFLGPITLPTSTVAVPTVIEYDGGDIKLIKDTSHEDADDRNQEWHWIVVMRYRLFRTRSQGLTAAGGPDIFKRKPNGVWGSWTKWDDNKKAMSFQIGYLKNEKGTWSMEVAPGLQPYGALAKLSNDLSGSQGSPYYLTVDQIVKAKPPSCEALFAMLPNSTPERAPGHSLSDSYKRTQTIADANASQGISDTVNPSYVKKLLRQPVCYSIDSACHVSGEGLWVPGDLEKPLDWNSFLQPDACALRQSAQIEVVLKDPASHDNRKRVITCIAASNLARVRKTLIDLGVKDAPPVDTEIAKNSSSPGAGAPQNTSAFREMPGGNGVTWANGDPIFKDGNTTVRLTHTLIMVQQGSTSAQFSIAREGTGIILVPPPDARSREIYNTQTHQYRNSNPTNGDATGIYPNGPPPIMMTKLAPFVQIAMKAIDQAKQTPGGTKWDDQYFRNVLKPYDTLSPSNPR